MTRPRKPTKPSKLWPLIRPLKRKGGKIVYQVDTRSRDGKQPKFKLLEQAEAYAEAMRRELANSGLEAFNITTAQREDAKKALDKLADAGLLGVRLEEIACYYIRHKRPEAGEIKLKDLRDKFLENRRADGVKEVTILGYIGRLKQFVNAIGPDKLVTDITEAEIASYLSRPDISNQSRRNDYAALWAMFEFAMRPKDYHGRDTKPDAPVSGYISRNPLLSIRRAKVEDDREPAVMDAESAAALLRAAYETRELPGEKPDSSKVGMLAEIVLELFVGVRPDSEIPHLNWSDIEYRGKGATLNIRKSKNKAGKRHITLPSIVVDWLRLCPKQEGPIHIAKNYRRRWERLKARANLTEWKQDILRHTAASVHYRLGQDAGKTRALLGHSISETGTLFGHYRAVMSETAAKKIMALTPAAVLGTPDNIVGIDNQPQKRNDSTTTRAKTKAKKVAAQ